MEKLKYIAVIEILLISLLIGFLICFCTAQYNQIQRLDKRITELAKKLRVMKKCGELETPISTRNLMAFDEHLEQYGAELGIQLFLNDFSAHERDSIKNVIELIFNQKEPASEVKQ